MDSANQDVKTKSVKVNKTPEYILRAQKAYIERKKAIDNEAYLEYHRNKYKKRKELKKQYQELLWLYSIDI